MTEPSGSTIAPRRIDSTMHDSIRGWSGSRTAGARRRPRNTNRKSRGSTTRRCSLTTSATAMGNYAVMDRLGYNPITQSYEDSDRGRKLQTYDEGKEVNRFVRSRNIVEKNNSQFNIITGERKPDYTQTVVP